MKFISLHIKEGMYARKIEFIDGVNLIFSKKNSRGKTTALRILLYGLGYAIPNTKKMKFEKLDIKLEVEIEKNTRVLLNRINKSLLELTVDNEKQTFILPNQQDALHKFLFKTDNKDILSNLLGSYYLDQEKGWTLLNRGKVIGEIRFNIESLIRGLSDIDCKNLIEKEKKLNNELEKYRQMRKFSEYRDSILSKENSLVLDTREDEINSELDQLFITEKHLAIEINRIDRTLSDNRRIGKYISEMKLMVNFNGEDICVSEENIVGLTDSIEFLKAKRSYISNQLKEVKDRILKIQKEKDSEVEKEYGQLGFFKISTQIEEFDKQVLQIPLNTKSIKKQIDSITEEKKKVTKKINKLTKESSKYVSFISSRIEKYGKELELENITKGYLFTDDLKVLSGAVLHKTAFVFRLAYVLAIQEKLNIKLPLILDSPSGKEIDRENVTKMMEILKRDFSENQIIIASIFDYDFDNINKIEIFDRLLEEIDE